jgi:hypothetical protein
VAPCGLISRCQCFGETYCLHLTSKILVLPMSPHTSQPRRTALSSLSSKI